MIDRPRWLSDRLESALLLSVVWLASLAAFGIVEPWMVIAGPAVLLATNRITARVESGSWAARYDDPDQDSEVVDDA